MNAGLASYRANGFSVNISGAARAMLECLEMAPKKFDLGSGKRSIVKPRLPYQTSATHLHKKGDGPIVEEDDFRLQTINLFSLAKPQRD